MTHTIAEPEATPPATPFHDLDSYVALPRLSGLTLSPEGDSLVVGVSSLNEDNTASRTALWEVDPIGARPARRLTRGLTGEAGATFTSDGDLLFVAKRATEEVSEEKAKPALWLLPAEGGEARQVATRPGGIGGVRAARSAPTVIVTAETMPSATDAESEQATLDARSEQKVAAILHSDYPIRFWDHDLGPAAPRLFAAGLPVAEDELDLRDLTPDAGKHLIEADTDLAADGSAVVTTWRVPMGKGAVRSQLVHIDVATGERTVLVDDSEAEIGTGRISPDGRQVAYVRESITTPQRAPEVTLWVCGIDGSNPRRIAAEWDRWPGEPVWLPDSSGVLMATDDDGRSPVFRVTLEGVVTRLTDDAASYTNVTVGPDGSVAFALRSSYEFPAEVVRIDLTGHAAQRVQPLSGPVPRPVLPGELREVETTAADGTRVRSWLALPEGASSEAPAPMLLWIHGGPLGSWNAWSWRWCPWLLVAQGYAVLLPDPALSTGYGQDFIQRGWGAWGQAPFTDLMAATDAAEALPEIDETRTAAMGGSFGGYMANWVAGHTDRFNAIVTHASLWALDGFGGTTDAGYYWNREMTPAMAEANSPHRSVDQIVTPMLVIHGDKDYRVPIGEGLRLWHDLLSASGLPAGEDGTTVHRFLYFPNENHWILTPQHAKVWYQVVSGFLAEHVLGDEAPALPEVLG
ncbi:S9 family peptidase [Ruania halotolerans]|uniref:S9 family peptidase n=1 Tax=Ruania halotolerans TaxID=2897773 RepID=UPI001E28C770|nr:prolyl oligopeptidase family serine peptidase [Ruania halotolerans]UFU06250.1 prolyl oligopeptidase family serine peptidase [Ruania halotolerans]